MLLGGAALGTTGAGLLAAGLGAAGLLFLVLAAATVTVALSVTWRLDDPEPRDVGAGRHDGVPSA
jgi:hypothetical protein